MLSPALSVPPPPRSPGENSPSSYQQPATRRRGLSYLRNLSSRDHSVPSPADPQRTSPRHFFTRSTSYQETKNNRVPEGRRRSQSHSRPHDQLASLESLERVVSDTGAEATTPAETQPEIVTTGDMARGPARASTTRRQTGEGFTEPPPVSRTASGIANGDTENKSGLPTIRFFPHQDSNRLGRQSLNFTPISRTLPNEGSIIKVGRYSEREGPPTANPIGPSEAPVGFKSKVVSRKHCEFCFVDGQWQIRDVASSSGTFLNHIRLSQPNQESRLYPIKDGDIVQLGIDFRGGEEMIFRCVKIRIECNRSWQKKPNTFNKARQAQIRGLVKDQPASGNSGECSICLGNVLPCQALFVAPCAHVWHYKCIRPMLEGSNSRYPQFQCPNCRAFSDLEADVDVDMEEWAEEDYVDTHKDLNIDQTDRPGQSTAMETDDTGAPLESAITNTALATNGHGNGDDTQISDAASLPQANLSNSSLLSRRQDRTNLSAPTNLSPPASIIPMPARPTESEMHDHLAQQRTQTESPNAEQIIAGEGTLTPRNNAGPFVFDGSGSRTGSRRQLTVPTIRSLDEVSDSRSD